MVGIGSKITALLLMAPPLAGCAAPTPAGDSVKHELAPTGTLRAAINYNNPLLARRDPASGTLSGLAVDLSRELARRIGVPLALVPCEAAAKITSTAKDNIWDIGYLAIDPLRANEIEFTAAYVELEGSYAVPTDSTLRAIGEVDRAGIRIAVTRGSAYDLYLSRAIQHAELIRVDNTPKSIEMLFAHEVDAVAAVRTALVTAVKTQPGFHALDGHFMTIPQAAGVPKGRVAAARYVSQFIEEVKGSGFVATTLKQYGLTPDDAIVAPPSAPR